MLPGRRRSCNIRIPTPANHSARQDAQLMFFPTKRTIRSSVSMECPARRGPNPERKTTALDSCWGAQSLLPFWLEPPQGITRMQALVPQRRQRPGPESSPRGRLPTDRLDVLTEVVIKLAVGSEYASVVLRTKYQRHVVTRDNRVRDDQFAKRLVGFLQTQIGKTIEEIGETEVDF